jgi:hypothetical protein
MDSPIFAPCRTTKSPAFHEPTSQAYRPATLEQALMKPIWTDSCARPHRLHPTVRIGWALLALQLLDIPAAMLISFYPALGDTAPHGTISIGGWIAVLMLFVLSRIFAAGAEMRDELEGTI